MVTPGLTGVAVKSFVAFSSSNLALWMYQVVGGTAGESSSIISAADRLTLSGALVCAVAVLWRALVKKDDAILTATTMVTKALQAQADSNIELRKIIEDSVKVNRDMVEAVELLRAGMSNTRKSGGGN